MAISLVLASFLLVGIASIHSILGERYILRRLFRQPLPPLFGNDTFTKQTILFAWHLTTVAWIGLALILIREPSAETVQIVGGIFLVSTLFPFFATKGKHLAWIVFLAIAILCLLSNQAAGAPDVSRYFQGEDACFELYDLSKDKQLYRYGAKRCAERLPACSTFKVALALIAFDTGTIKDENTPFKWDGKDYGMELWNKDQTAASWLKNSVVWVSQRLTKQIGQKPIEKYLKEFGFGNADMSGGIETAWLTLGTQSSLLISADEQLRFFRKLWKGTLPVSKKAIDLTKKLLYQDTLPTGYRLSGKTGSGFMGSNRSPKIGWFVAHVSNDEKEYVSVVSLTTSKDTIGPYAGPEAQKKTKRILSELEIF